VVQSSKRAVDQVLNERFDALLYRRRCFSRELGECAKVRPGFGTVAEEPLIRLLRGRAPLLVPTVGRLTCEMSELTFSINERLITH
jgi:hypothetical protein